LNQELEKHYHYSQVVHKESASVELKKNIILSLFSVEAIKKRALNAERKTSVSESDQANCLSWSQINIKQRLFMAMCTNTYYAEFAFSYFQIPQVG
jgi:hypothetical protein